MFIQLPSALDTLLEPGQPERLEPEEPSTLTVAPAPRSSRWAVGSMQPVASRGARTWTLRVQDADPATLTWTAPAT